MRKVLNPTGLVDFGTSTDYFKSGTGCSTLTRMLLKPTLNIIMEVQDTGRIAHKGSVAEWFKTFDC